MVNYSLHFVDTITGVYTKNVELLKSNKEELMHGKLHEGKDLKILHHCELSSRYTLAG